MDARTVAHLYGVLKREWKLLEEVRRFIDHDPAAGIIDQEIAKRRSEVVRIGKKLEKIEFTIGEAE
ncbi:hypothetical protein [Bacillus amyloliquefaciens]|uniref:hypothetical protein n=1 Tax=Bacillus amyloliquefaciens TaxID=1390 RepID=UPI0011C70C6B|nr:hypothetical protein [Bacillus amyloliquefaciens]TXK24530.1 hypothetical protein FVD42_11215 [Bacillus amyloliquefaciens]TXK30745.1 hypothetical protein FVD41_11150 [Bacillus amyloliquefaciens]